MTTVTGNVPSQSYFSTESRVKAFRTKKIHFQMFFNFIVFSKFKTINIYSYISSADVKKKKVQLFLWSQCTSIPLLRVIKIHCAL